ncbi:MAG: hypothetical protein WC575_04125 [Patescibacteria group bacterium]
MTPDYPINSGQQELKKLLEQNLEYSKEILKSTEKVRRYILTRQIFSFVKLVVIIGLIVLGFITIKPWLNQAIGTYQELLGTTDAVKGAAQSVSGENQNLLQLIDQYKATGQVPTK